MNAPIIFQMKGFRYVELYNDLLRWEPSSIFFPKKEIFINSITSIEYTEIGSMRYSKTYGQLSINYRDKSGTIQNAGFLFSKENAEETLRLKSALEEKISKAQQHTPISTSAEASYIDQIAKLAMLRDRGILTEDEFQIEKKQLLEKANQIKKTPCQYCGLQIEITSAKCPGCGAPVRP